MVNTTQDSLNYSTSVVRRPAECLSNGSWTYPLTKSFDTVDITLARRVVTPTGTSPDSNRLLKEANLRENLSEAVDAAGHTVLNMLRPQGRSSANEPSEKIIYRLLSRHHFQECPSGEAFVHLWGWTVRMHLNQCVDCSNHIEEHVIKKLALWTDLKFPFAIREGVSNNAFIQICLVIVIGTLCVQNFCWFLVRKVRKSLWYQSVLQFN